MEDHLPQRVRVERRAVSEEESRLANGPDWDRYADEYQATHGGFLGNTGFVWGPEGLTEDDAAVLGDVAGREVLEVGSGAGQCSRWVRVHGGTSYGLDLSARQLQHSRRIDEESGVAVPSVLATATALPFADAAFDVALGAFVVNHLPHPERAAAELRRVARTVALAMWGPEDEVGLLGLPASAARDLDAGVPPGPDSLRFTDAGELARLIGGTVDETTPTLHIDDLDELWDGVRGGTVRTAARLAAATPAQLEAARTRLCELAEPYRTRSGYDLPTTIRIALAG